MPRLDVHGLTVLGSEGRRAVDGLSLTVRAGERICDLQRELVAARESLRYQATHDHLTAAWNRAAALDEVGPLDLAPVDAAAADRLRRYLQAWALPQQPLSAPMSVVYSGKDTFLDSEWTKAAIARACSLGGTVVWNFQPDGGHADIDGPGQLRWLAERFGGGEAVNDCPAQGTP